MKIKARLDKNTTNRFYNELHKWELVKDKGIKDGILLLAKASSKALIQKTRPLGLSAQVGKKFEGSIARQVFKGVLRQTTTSARSAHKQSRNSKGQVQGKLYIVKGHTKFADEAERVIDRKKSFAGMLKAAWGVAFSKLKGSTKIKGISKWISRHFGRTAIGSASMRSNRLGFTISLNNEMDGATNENVLTKQALSQAFKTTIKQVERTILGKKTTI